MQGMIGLSIRRPLDSIPIIQGTHPDETSSSGGFPGSSPPLASLFLTRFPPKSTRRRPLPSPQRLPTTPHRDRLLLLQQTPTPSLSVFLFPSQAETHTCLISSPKCSPDPLSRLPSDPSPRPPEPSARSPSSVPAVGSVNP